MDLNSTRTAANTITPAEEAPTQKYGQRLTDYYVKKADSLSDEWKDPERLAQHAYSKASDKDAMDYDTWKAFHGVDEFVANAPTAVEKAREQKAFDESQPEDRGFLAGSAAALGRGAMNVVGATGQALGLADLEPSSIDTDKGYLDRVGEGMTQWADDKKATTQFMRPTKEEERGDVGTIKKGWEGALESLPLTGGVAASAAAGAGIGSIAGPVGTAVGATIGGLVGMGALFGAGTYGQSYDRAYKELKEKRPDATEDEVRAVAQKGALIDAGLETGSELVSDLAAVLTLGGTKMIAQPLTKTLKEIVKPGFKTYLLNTLKQMPFEVGSEVGTAYGQAAWREQEGLDGGDRIAAMGDAVLPAIFMSAVLGTGVAGYREVTARKTLTDINADDPATRIKAVEDIANRVVENTEDKELAQTWLDFASQRIQSGEKIDVDESVAQWSAAKTREDAQAAGRTLPSYDPQDVASEGVRQSLAPKSEAEKMLTGDADVTPTDILMGADERPTPVPGQNEAWLEEQEAAWQREQAEAMGVTDNLDAEWQNRAEAQQVAAETRMLDAEWDTRQRIQELNTQIRELESGRGRKTKKRMESARAAKQERKRLMDMLGQGQNVATSPQVTTNIPANIPAETSASSQPVGNIPGQQAQGLQIQPSELAPSFQDSTVSELPDISREGFNGEGVKEIKTWWGVKSTDTIRQIKRAQVTGENITLAEAERRGREDAARRESERRAVLSGEEAPAIEQSQGAGSEKQTAKQEKESGRTANDYTVETEDFGTMGVRVIRSEDGSVTIFTDKNTITHNSDFASGKSDEDLLAYSFEPSGFKGASRVENALDQKAHEAATSPLNDRPEPTEAQIDAGNYKKGKVSIDGLMISIENPAGSVRSGKDAQGREWATEMRHHYGYIRGTKGADKDHVDVFIAPGAEAGGPVFVVNQNDPATGKFDEHKAIIGAANEQEARDIYLANYEPGWQGLGSIAQMSMDEFKTWAKSKKTAKPVVGKAEAAADLPGAGTVTTPSQGEASTIPESPTLPAEQRIQEQAGWMASPGQRPSIDEQFDTMVKDAARWQGAARNLARELKDDKRASVRLSKITTKGDLDVYLMRKYGIDAAEARSVSNHLTAKDIPADMTATVEEFKDEPWAKEMRKEKPKSKPAQEPTAAKPQGKVADNREGKAGNQGIDTVESRETYVRQIASLMRNRRYKDADLASRTAAKKLGLPKADAKKLYAEATLIEQRSGDRFEKFTQEEQNKATQLVPSPEWIRVNRDKTVEANIPEAAKEKLTLKQQKAWLLAEIDKAMKSGRKDGKPFEFHVPGDGHFRIKADQLAEFKKRVEDRFPEKERPSALGKNPPRPVQSSKGRITEGEYYNEWQDHSVQSINVLKREDGDPLWDSDNGVALVGGLMLSMDKIPMIKKIRSSKGAVTQLLGTMREEMKRDAEIVGQFKFEGTEENPGDVMAHVRYDADGEQRDTFVKAERIDAVRTQYPGATIRVSPDGKKVGFFDRRGNIVGAATADPGVELTDYHKGRMAELTGATQEDAPAAPSRDDYADLFDEELAAATAPKPKKPLVKKTAEERAQAAASRAPREKKPLVKKPKDQASDAAKKMADGAAAALDVFSKYGGLSVRVVKEGEEINQDLYRELKPHLLKVLEGAREMGHAGKDLAREVVRFLIKAFGEKAAQAKPYFMRFVDEEILGRETKEQEDGISPEKPGRIEVLEGQADMADGQRAGAGGADVSAPRGADDVPGRAGDTGRSAGVEATEGGQPAGRGRGDSNVDGRPGRVDESERGANAGANAQKDSAVGKRSARQNARNHRVAPDDVLVPGGTVARAKANIAAIRLLKKLQEESREATPEEKKTLQMFSGWGSLAQEVFKPEFDRAADYEKKYGHSSWQHGEAYQKWKAKYGDLHPSLGGLMTREEWDAAKDSTLNAHYTDRSVIEAMWKMVERMGFEGGRVLEPSAGTGLFFGLMPEGLAENSKLVGVELDSLTGAILEKLYPDADIQVAGFEKAKRVGDNTLDLVISNFPFGNFSVFDKARPEYSKQSIHNYFFSRAIDAVHPGGLVVAVTSHFTMDAGSSGKIREMWGRKADLVAAVRLPGTAFEKNAGTQVTTDILIFRKKTDEPFDGAQQFRHLAKAQTPEGETQINEYFVAHPEMALGEHSLRGSMYGGKDEYTLAPGKEPMEVALSRVIDVIPKDIFGRAAVPAKMERTSTGEAATAAMREGTLVEKDGKVFLVEDGMLVDPGWKPAQMQQAKAYLSVKKAAIDIIDAMGRVDDDAQIAEMREHLNKVYDAYVKKHGHINRRGVSFLEDDLEFPTVAALENAVEVEVEKVRTTGAQKGQKYTVKERSYVKADIFSKRTIYPFREPFKADDLEDAIKISRVYRNGINVEYIADLLGISQDSARGKIIESKQAFENPDTGLLEPRDLYLSGNVREKLRVAKTAAEENDAYRTNVEALETVQPARLSIDAIRVRLGSYWLPEDAVAEFLGHLGVNYPRAERLRVEGTEGSTSWSVGGDAGADAQNKWGVDGADAMDIVLDSLNLKRTEIFDTVSDGDKTRRVKNVEKSLAAQEKQREIQDEFRKWVIENDAIAKKIEDIYNENFNGHVVRKFEAPDIKHYPGAVQTIELRENQKTGVSRALQESTLLAHGVGSGKTFLQITLAMEMRRLGTAKKPWIVVQGSTLSQFAASFKQLYPGARILAPTEGQRTAKNRQRLLAQVASGDWDAIITPHGFFNSISIDPDNEARFIQEQIDEFEQMIWADFSTAGMNERQIEQNPTVKAIRKKIKAMKTRLEKLANTKKDKNIFFEDLGVDALIIDEAHAYKRGSFYTKMDNVKGLDRDSSQRSMQLLMKARNVQEKTGGKNVILATGTPISNTLTEMWTMFRYIRPDLLSAFGVEQFDDFASTFADTSVSQEETSTGDFKDVERFNVYVNGPELLTMWRTGADVAITEDLDYIKGLPKLKGGKIHEVAVERSEELANYIRALKVERDEWDRLSGKEKRETSHVPLTIFGRAKKAAIDLRLIDPGLTDAPESKANIAVANIYGRWADNKDTKATQIVFSDMFQSSDKTFNLFHDIRDKLIEKGVPAKEIAIIHDFKTDDARAKMFDKVKSGEIRVLMGTTEKLGVGVNVQDRLLTAHHLDAPPRPMDFEQRNGRIRRPGNMHPEVEILVYGTKNTLDSVTFQQLISKQKFINQVLRGEMQGRSFDNPFDEVQATFADMMAAFSGNPLAKEKMKLMSEHRRLLMLKQAHDSRFSGMRFVLRHRQEAIPRLEADLAEAERAQAYVKKNFADGVSDRKDVTKKIQEWLDATEKEVVDSVKEIKTSDQWKAKVTSKMDKRTAFDLGHGVKVEIVAFPKASTENGKNVVDHRMVTEFTYSGPHGIRSKFAEQFSGASGLITRFENRLDAVLIRPDEIRGSIKRNAEQIVAIKGEVGKPFDKQGELDAAEKRLDEIEAELAAAVNEDLAATKDEAQAAVDGQQAQYQVMAQPSTPSAIDIRAAFPWADSIEEVDGKTVITKGKVSFAVEQVEQITPDEVAFKLAYGRQFDPKTDQIAGDYKGGTIRISKAGDNWTAKHEHYHFLEDMGLVTKFEQAVLDAAIKKADKAGTLGFKPTTPAENRAYFVQHALEKRDFQRKTTLGRVLQKIADFVDALVNLAVRTSRGIVRDVESGKMMGRDGNAKAMMTQAFAGYQATEITSTATAIATKARELTSDIMHRPEVFGRFKWINTQLHKALRNPAFKRIFDRFHAAAGTQSRSAARAAGLAQDILPDYSGNAKQTLKRLFARTTDVTREDMRSVSRIMSMETLAGKNASPFAGHRLTEDELATLGRGETVTLGGNEIKMTAKQVDLYRQARSALDQMLNEMATSEAWKVMRGVLPEDLRDYWEVFANNPVEVQDAMGNMLDTELRNAEGRLAQAERDALDFATAKDMEGFAKYGKVLDLLDKAIRNKDKFSKKKLEDGDLDELIAKREEKIDKMADALGITPEDAEERLAEFKRLRKDHADKAQHVENVKDAQAKIADVFDKSQKLIKAGYAPLSRFGKYRIDVHNDEGKLIHVSFYDTSTEANRERRALVAQFADYPDGGNVGEVATVSEEDWKLFQGANPEALRIFAQNAGADSDEAIQAYYQDAVSSRSALKRLINRKGYAGYSDDLQRILASFVTSGAKRVSSNYHAAEIFDMVNDKTLAADLRDEANKLKQFVDNPGDAGSGFRAFAANWYMLGSFMSAAWNGTQVISSTLPELYKHSGSVSRSAKDIGKAYKSIILKHADLTTTEMAALKKAMEDGTVDAAEVHHLYAQATKRFIASLGDGAIAEKAGAILRLWGMPFAWFETMNRKASFIAAYRMAEDQGMDVDEAYQFAKQIVDITQGIYVKHNRPNVARSAAGGAILTFMQYRIMTLEQIARNAKEGGQARKAAALQLAIIMSMGGWAALPLAEDIMDIFDAIMQVVGGRAWLTKKQLREAIEKGSKDAAGLLLEKQAADAVGKVMADFMNIGIVSTVLPVNVAGRAGFGNVVPLAKLLKPSTQYRDSEVFDALGVPGSMAQSLVDASGMLLHGDVGRATMRLAPNALAAVAKGVDIAATGEIKNTRGRKVTDGSMLDAAIQTVGGQPSRKAAINNRMRENQELKYLTQQEERSIVNEWADAYEQKGVVAQSAALKAVRERIAGWNRKNPEWPIVVKQSQVMRELQNRRKTTVELAAKGAPKELRKSMAVE